MPFLVRFNVVFSAIAFVVLLVSFIAERNDLWLAAAVLALILTAAHSALLAFYWLPRERAGRP